MKEQKDNNAQNFGQVPEGQRGQLEQTDPAAKSLAEALRVSFKILKWVMVVLVILFLASGFFTVGPDERAMVLRFGKIRGIAEQRILGPGLHWAFPYPVEEVVKLPVEKVQTLATDDFWYFQTEQQKLAAAAGEPSRNVPATLDLLRGDGYCITRNDSIAQIPGNDYNIVHCKWQLTWSIRSAEVFFQNVFVPAPRPGQDYGDVIPENVSPVLRSILCDAVVTSMVNFSIDEAILSAADIAREVKQRLQDKLDRIESGITVVSLELSSITWPRQVDDAFQRSIQASQRSQQLVTEARGYAENLLGEAGGPFVYDVLETLNDTAIKGSQAEDVWARLSGTAQEKLSVARAYKTEVVETARADARYLKELLPEYRKRPQLVLQEIYQDAVEEVLDGAEEKIILEPAPGGKKREIRVLIGRGMGADEEAEQ